MTPALDARARAEPAPSERFAPARVIVRREADGGLHLSSPLALPDLPRHLGLWLEAWAQQAPERTFLAERAGAPLGQGWRTLTYTQTWTQVRGVAQALIDRDLDPDRPALILAENGIDHAVLALACMQVGLVAAPVSTAYARLSRDFAKLRHILDLVRPQLVYVDDPARYAEALAGLDLGGAELVASTDRGEGPRATAFASLAATTPTGEVARRAARLNPDTVAKLLFTSGSTDLPKGVINTQRMLVANQESIALVWPFLEQEPPVIVDWLPWNHTFGGNHNFNLVLRNGGTLFINEGKPAPPLIGRTVANLRDVSPTLYFDVPRGYGMLLDHLEADEGLNRTFFARLELLFYAGAALPQSLWERLERCSLRARGEVVPMVSSWGATETAPMVTTTHFPVDRAGIIGLPAPGNELRLVPVADRLEMLVRGPNVTPGYWRRPDLTAGAFDDGWWRTGDAGRFADPSAPEKGIVFDGRVAENFKLTSGTWVNVGALRVAALAAASPLIEDAVVTGHDRDGIGLIAFPNLAACRGLCPELDGACPPAEVAAHSSVREALRRALAGFNAEQGGSSTRITAVILTTEPPSIDANEITDKGYLNQRAVLARRAALVERLHASPADPEVILIG